MDEFKKRLITLCVETGVRLIKSGDPVECDCFASDGQPGELYISGDLEGEIDEASAKSQEKSWIT